MPTSPIVASWTLPMQWDFLNLPPCLTRTLLNAMGYLFGKTVTTPIVVDPANAMGFSKFTSLFDKDPA